MSEDEGRAKITADWLDSEEATRVLGASLPAVRRVADAAKRDERVREAGLDEEVWLTTGTAAKILGASLPTVRRMTDGGLLVGRRTRSWTTQGTDRRGHELRGHRRVSLTSVVMVKTARERAEREEAERAERERAERETAGAVKTVQDPSS